MLHIVSHLHCFRCHFLIRSPPFPDDKQPRKFEPVVKSGYGPWFPEAIPMSDGAKDLLKKLLNGRVEERFTCQEALEHPWYLVFVQQMMPGLFITLISSILCFRLRGTAVSDQPLDKSMVSMLGKFDSGNRFRVATCQLMAQTVPPESMARLKEAFTAVDINHDGQVTVEELQRAIAAQKDKDAKDTSTAELAAMFDQLDVDKSGTLSMLLS